MRLQQRVERLEEELAWTRLVASALAALCVEKGVTTPEELKERIGRLDAAEGIEHGNPAPAPPPTAPTASDARRAARRRKFPRRD